MRAYGIERAARAAVVRLIRDEPDATRVSIARDLGLSASMVTRTVASLIEDDLVVEGATIEREAAGRRPTALHINGDAYHLMGIEADSHRATTAIVSLGGTIIHEREYDLEGLDGDAAVDAILDGGAEVLELATAEGLTVRGIGVGAPGVTDFENGSVVWAPAFGWSNVPLRDRFESRFAISTFVENDVNLAAVGEHWLGAGRGSESLVYLFARDGMGAGIVINGELYRGRNRGAGEVGYVVPDRTMLNGRHTDIGAVESLTNSAGLRALLERSGLPASDETGELTTSGVLRRAATDPTYRAAADELLDAFAQVIASIVAVVDPGVVVLGGELADAHPWTGDDLEARLAHVLPPGVVDIRPSTLGRSAGVLGAAAFALLEVEGLQSRTARWIHA